MKEIELELALIQLKGLGYERAIVTALLLKAKNKGSSFPTVDVSYKSMLRENKELRDISYEEFEKHMDSLASAFLILKVDPATQKGYKKDKQYQVKKPELERLIEGNEYSIRRFLNTFKNDHTMPKQDLLTTIPTEGKKYRHLRPIAEILTNYSEADMFLLAKKLKGEFGIESTRPNRPYYRLTRKRYETGRERFNNLLDNRFKTLERKWKRYGYSIEVNREANTAQLVNSSQSKLRTYMEKLNLLPYLQQFL